MLRYSSDEFLPIVKITDMRLRKLVDKTRMKNFSATSKYIVLEVVQG